MRLLSAFFALLSLSIGNMFAGPNGKLTFLGGVTDSAVNQWPDTVFTGLGIWNQASFIYSDNAWAVMTGPTSYNWTNFDAHYSWTRANHLKELWYTGFAAAVSGSWPANLGDSQAQFVNDFKTFLSLAAARAPNIEYINYCNEGLLHSDASGWMQQAFGGAGYTGYDWIINIGKAVRQYFPKAKIGINDFEFESAGNDLAYGNYGGDPTQLSTILPILSILKNAGVLDWVGMEGYSMETSSNANILGALNAVGAYAPVIYTEFSPYANAGPSIPDSTVAAAWANLLPLIAGNQYSLGITGPWGYLWSNTQNGGIGGSQWILDNRNNPSSATATIRWLQANAAQYVGAGP